MKLDWSQILSDAYQGSWYIWIIIFLIGFLMMKFNIEENKGIGLMSLSSVFTIVGLIALMMSKST